MLCTDLKNPQSKIKQKSNFIIQQIYIILNQPSPKTALILTAWKEHFQYIYGVIDTNLASNNKLDADEILTRYGIDKHAQKEIEETQLLFFSIQTYFSILIKCMMNSILNEKKAQETSSTELLLGTFANKRGIR